MTDSPWRYARWVAAAALLVGAPVFAAAYPAAFRILPRAARPAGPAPALFSHRTHGTFGCYACHPAVFPQAPLGFTHADMAEGRFCGSCHEGKAAFAINSAACTDCHVQ